MGRKHRTYPDDKHNDENNQIKAKNRKIKELEAENKSLKSQLKTLERAFDKTSKFIKGNLDGFTVEKAIAAAKEEKTLVEIQKESGCPSCGEGTLTTSRGPFGQLELCSAGCGYRKVIKEKKDETET